MCNVIIQYKYPHFAAGTLNQPLYILFWAYEFSGLTSSYNAADFSAELIIIHAMFSTPYNFGKQSNCLRYARTRVILFVRVCWVFLFLRYYYNDEKPD